MANNSDGGFPKIRGAAYRYRSAVRSKPFNADEGTMNRWRDPRITVREHFVYDSLSDNTANVQPPPEVVGSYNYYKQPHEHFIRDLNQPGEESRPTTSYDDGVTHPAVSGSVTNINPLGNETIKQIEEEGLEHYDQYYVRSKSDYIDPPLSPVHPFVRQDPTLTHATAIMAYNRTRTPIADVAFRKAFRYLFFSRPECYVMGISGAGKVSLSEQCMNDDDFLSSFKRMPQISMLLSPSYVTGATSYDSIVQHNWNYLLSNYAQGLSVGDAQLSMDESANKTVEGFSIPMPTLLESRKGNSITITFNETKNLEVSEFLRMWMLYCYKRARGIFSPSFNGYRVQNSFLNENNSQSSFAVNPDAHFHPYDRAIEYTCSLFDIITNETGSKIIRWEKYFGLIPTQYSITLANDMNAPIDGNNVKVTATFHYLYKEENTNKTLMEFNFNAGVVDNMGKLKVKNPKASMPFLYKNSSNINDILPKYIGGAGMFTGSPYIVLNQVPNINPMGTEEGSVFSPFLNFFPINQDTMDYGMNKGLIKIQDAIGTPYGL